MNDEMIYTIGHSTHPIEKFISLLRQHEISALVDVRSTPFSRFNPQFNQSPLKKSLDDNDIKYLFMGKELGARSDDSSCYENGKVKYSLLAKSPLFLQGTKRLRMGMQEYRIALMCAEQEPLDCHRTVLVSEFLVKNGISVSHIRSDGTLESHEETLERLLVMFKLSDSDMFRSKEVRLVEALEKQEERIAYQDANQNYDEKEAV